MSRYQLEVLIEMGKYDEVLRQLNSRIWEESVLSAALYDIAATQALEIAAALLDSGANVNVKKGRYGETPLHSAVDRGNLALAELLLARGANPNPTSNSGFTPLHNTAKPGNLAIAELLLRHGADPNHASNDGVTPLHNAAKRGNLALAELLLAHGADPNHASNARDTPLHLAAHENHAEVARCLLIHGARPDGVPGTLTPLHLAAIQGAAESARWLLEHGADVSSSATELQRTPLHAAALGGHPLLIEALVARGASLEARDAHGNRALGLAAAKGHLAAVEMLLALGAAADDPPGLNDLPPLRGAAGNGHQAIAELLLAHGASVDTRNSRGCSLLCGAVQAESVDFIKQLIAAGATADCHNAEPHQTALHRAAHAGSLPLVELLLAHGAAADRRNAQGLTPLHLAVDYVCKTNAGALRIVELLLLAGADPDAPARALKQVYRKPKGEKQLEDTWRPFPYAAAKQQRALALLLREYGADINLPGCAEDKPETTAIEAAVKLTIDALDDEDDEENYEFIAAENLDWLLDLKPAIPPQLLPRLLKDSFPEEYLPVLHCLIEAGADVRGPNVMGAAVDSGNATVVRYLAAAGADVDSPYQPYSSKIYATALEQAIASVPALAMVLIDLGADLRRTIPGPLILSVAEARRHRAAPEADYPLLTYADLARAHAERDPKPLRLELVETLAQRIAATLEFAADAADYRAFVSAEFAERIRQNNGAAWRPWLERGANVNLADSEGQLPLARLLGRGELAAAALLHERGAELNRRDRFGRSPLHWATEAGQAEAVEQALVWGADANAATDYGYTALHYAALAGRADLVRRLLAAGADPSAQVGAGRLAGWTPLHFAYAVEDLDTMLLLDEVTPQITPPDGGGHRIGGTYDVIMGRNDWHKPCPISPEARRCPECGEQMVYNTAHTFDDSGHMADRVEVHDCGNCRRRYWENGMGKGPQPLQPWSTFIQH